MQPQPGNPLLLSASQETVVVAWKRCLGYFQVLKLQADVGGTQPMDVSFRGNFSRMSGTAYLNEEAVETKPHLIPASLVAAKCVPK